MRSIIAPLSLLVASVGVMLYPAVEPAVAAWSTRSIKFSGYEWQIKKGERGPGPNFWSSHEKDVFIDANGALHLHVTKRDNQWYSTEVKLPRSLGYGTYEFVLGSRIDKIDPNLVFGPFLYQDDTHEINMEFSRWKGTSWFNSYYTVQPFYLRETNQRRYRTDLTSNSPTKVTMKWTPEKITLMLSQKDKIINSFVYSGQHNFPPGNERLRLSFWQYEGSAPADGKRHTFIIKSFKFTPYK